MTIKDRTMVSSVTFGAELPKRQAAKLDESPFRILVIGNLGADSSFHTPVAIDRDDLDRVMEQLQVHTTLRLDKGDAAFEIRFSEFEDFHPDRLFNRLSVFEALRLRRQRLLNDSTCREEIATILRSKAAETAGDQSVNLSTSHPVTSDSGDSELLSQVLGNTQALQKPLEQQVFEGSVDWDVYVRQLVAPYLLDKTDPRQAELIAGVDAAVADTMRDILHNSAFQQSEAVWQGIRFLTRRLETDRTLQLSVMHVTSEDLAADVFDGEELSHSKVYRTLVDDVAAEGAEPWSLIVGDFQFGKSHIDFAKLVRIARICRAAGSIFLSGVASEITGCPGFAQNGNAVESTDPRDWTSQSDDDRQLWNSIRKLPASQHVILALPRLLARRPYAPESDPIESFTFSELPDGTRHGEYLWMNAAFGVASLLGQSFASTGWDFAHSIPTELERIPQFLFTQSGEETVQPGSEGILSERAAEAFAQFGLTVFRSVRNDDVIRVAAVRTLSASNPGLPD